MHDFAGKNIVVVGAGRSGLALAAYFRDRGGRVVLSDSRSAERLGPLPDLGPAVICDLGGHSESLFLAADLVAISPGVPLTLPPVAAALSRGVPVLGEIEIAGGELDAPLAAITGTNGKSTTTSVMGEAFRAWGKRTFVGGNLGIPLIEAVGTRWDWLVAEISSFQLEAIETFHPRYALLLNLTEDHLDRYPDMASYIAAKMRLFANMTADDVAVLNAEDPLVMAAAAGLPTRQILFS
ncbi:MAG: UDP-N-acetylmuramoyl-L-alanine--D-glutamate ligase, partial [Desulfuromonadales bacterium]|nr:UDP-N-acetylmuramoyl-L-alanine--D-glutamate ligase [Desulfuromonadales bacterium]